MKLVRGRRIKPKTETELYADTHKKRKDEFLKSLNDSRYSLYVIKVQGIYLWESNFCGIWIATNPDLEKVLSEMLKHRDREKTPIAISNHL
jgi:hypothetical protein